MASHAFITTWLMAPGGASGVDWGAGRLLGSQKGVWEGGLEMSDDIWVTGVSDHSISWGSNIDEPEVLGVHGSYTGPDVYVFFKNGANMEIGGFLDHWNGPGTGRSRNFENIKEFWKCRNGRPMDPKAIYRTGMYVQIGIQGNRGSRLSQWHQYR